MKIILEREEYEGLRPNLFAVQFVESVKTILAKHNESGDRARTLGDIHNALEDYESKVKKAATDDEFRLWPE